MPASGILHFVGDRRRHLAERRQPVAQPLPLFELLDAGQILEEQRRAGDAAVAVADLRERVADHLAGALQPQLGPVRQVRQLEGAGDDAADLLLALQHLGEGLADVGRPPLQPQNLVGDVVHDRHRAVARHGQDPVPQAPHQIPEESVRRDSVDPARRPS